MPRASASTVAAMLALAACRAPDAGPLAPEGVDSTFEHLSRKYDRDGDGVVTVREYTRGGDAFARLDSTGDGRLAPDDFPDERWARDLGIRDLPEDVRRRLGARYAARAVVLAYFQPDDAGGELARESLERGFARLDRDGSQTLEAAEFARATDALPWGGPGDAWEVLQAALGAAPSEPVTLDGLRAYHQAMAGPDGVLRGPPGVDPRAAAPGLAGDGPPVGAPAPDFELAPLHGGARVRLSQWRGRKPVALVFGSYT